MPKGVKKLPDASAKTRGGTKAPGSKPMESWTAGKVDRNAEAVPRDVVGARNIADMARTHDGKIFKGYEKRGGMAHTFERSPNASARAKAAAQLSSKLKK